MPALITYSSFFLGWQPPGHPLERERERKNDGLHWSSGVLLLIIFIL